MTTGRNITGVLFDLGDTLLRFGKVETRGVFEEGAELAYAYLESLGQPLPSFAQFHARQFRTIRWHVLKSRLTRREFNALELLLGQSRRMGQDLTHDQATELAWMWYRPLHDQARVEPDTRDVLRRLRDDGIVLGLVSNTFIPGQVLDRHLDEEGLLEFFPVRVYSCDVGYRKPHRRIFGIACQRAGLQPAQTMYVGDSLRADVYGANRAGLISVLFDPEDENPPGKRRPRFRVTALSQVPEIVEECNAPG